jgi:hypothetical protein
VLMRTKHLWQEKTLSHQQRPWEWAPHDHDQTTTLPGDSHPPPVPSADSWVPFAQV